MPIYEVYHRTPLSDGQKTQIADAITARHSERFTTPRLFVNVIFTDSSKRQVYINAKPRYVNTIVGNVRVGKRSADDFNALCGEINSAWASIVHPDRHVPSETEELRAIFITGELIAGTEAGIVIPSAGHDLEWAAENMEIFKAKAAAGDQDFVELLAEMNGRPEFTT